MNMRNARSNWVKFISYSARPNHIWPQRAWNRLLFATHSHSLAAVFPLLFCQFYIFRRAKRKEKKRLQAKSSVDMLVSFIHLISRRIWYHSDIHFRWCAFAQMISRNRHPTKKHKFNLCGLFSNRWWWRVRVFVASPVSRMIKELNERIAYRIRCHYESSISAPCDWFASTFVYIFFCLA